MFNFFKPGAQTSDIPAAFADWLRKGDNGELAEERPNEQRVYDAFTYLTSNVESGVWLENRYISVWDRQKDLILRVNVEGCRSYAELERGRAMAKVPLLKIVAIGLVDSLKAALECAENRDMQKMWPLPTVWDKPKAQKKGK